MDILYITEEAKQELLNYCEQSLVDYVFEDFKKFGRIIEKKSGEPSRWWIVDDFISHKTIENKCKFAVILSLAAIGGIVQLNGVSNVGDVNTLCAFKNMNVISEDELTWFADVFFAISHGKPYKFSLKDGCCVVR